MPEKPETTFSPSRVRFDKWLWAARFYKTRSLASQAIEAGQARVGEDRVKPAHIVRIGERVVLRRDGLVWDVVVTAISERRGGAPDAAKMYTESAESVAAREQAITARKAASSTAPAWAGRPTKRDRRKIRGFLDEL